MRTTVAVTPDHDLPDGPHAGRDDQLRSAAQESLRSSGYPLLRNLSCEVAGGVVTLSGSVPTYHLKQVAQSRLMRLGSLRGVRNLLVVL